MESSLITDIFVIVGLNLLFAAPHSILASNRLKSAVAGKFPGFMPFYRLAYNAISLISIYLLVRFAPRPDIIIYKIESPLRYFIFALQAFGISGFLYTLWYFDGSELLGLNQVIRKMKGRYDVNSLDEESRLMVKGPYRYSRHPLYFFCFFITLAWPKMDLFYFITAVSFVAYFYIGSVYEERKLVERFGDDYRLYQASTGRIFPKLKSLIK